MHPVMRKLSEPGELRVMNCEFNSQQLSSALFIAPTSNTRLHPAIVLRYALQLAIS